MRRAFTLLILGIILVATFGGFYLIAVERPLVMIHGYDGPTATIIDVESDADRSGSTWIESISPSSASAYPPNPDLLDLIVSCGTHMTIQSAPVVANTEVLDEITVAYVDEEKKTNMTKTWSIQEVECHMGVTVETYKGGLMDTLSTIYWVKLEKNALSVFSTADESEAYIIQVFAYDVGDKTGSIEVTGEDKGFSFDLTSLENVNIPDWILESGYTENLQFFSKVKFPIEVLEAAPTNLGGLARGESKIDLHLSVMVLLFGEWERTVKYVDWKGADNPDPFAWLWELIAAIVTFLWFIIGIVGTVIIAWKVPDPKFKAIGIIILWGVVLWQTGTLAMIMEVFTG